MRPPSSCRLYWQYPEEAGKPSATPPPSAVSSSSGAPTITVDDVTSGSNQKQKKTNCLVVHRGIDFFFGFHKSKHDAIQRNTHRNSLKGFVLGCSIDKKKNKNEKKKKVLPEPGKESNFVLTDIKTKRPNFFDAALRISWLLPWLPTSFFRQRT